MWHFSRTNIDVAGNTVESHYQRDLAGNWVLVGAIVHPFLRGATEFKRHIDENRKRKRSEIN
jgi:hypothetical protein